MSFKSLAFLSLFFVLCNSRIAVADTVYTANEAAQSISSFSWPGKGDVKTIEIDGMPHNVQAIRDGEIVLATVMGMGIPDSLLIFKRDALELNLVRVIPVGHHPAHVVADRKGRTAYVTLSGEDAVAAVDIDSGNVIKKIKTGSYPHGLRISPDNREIYVANMKADTVSVIDVEKMEETGRISVKGHPVQVGFTQDGKKAFVTLNDMGGVAVIDTGAREVEKTIDTGPGPAQVYVGRDYAFIANQGIKENPGHTVTAIDVHDMTVKGEIPAGNGPHGVNVSPDGQMVYITNVYDGTVSVIDGRSFSVVGTIKVGGGPNGITSTR